MGRLYMMYQSRKAGSRFANADYTRRYKNILRVVSLVLCALAILILHNITPE